MLRITKLHASVGGKEIIRDMDFSMKDGEVHVIMGPNGSGKSTLSYAIAGHPKYTVGGKIWLDKSNIARLLPNERAKKGVFLAFQNPVAVEGLGLMNFIRKARGALGKSSPDITKFGDEMRQTAKTVGMDESFLTRELNVGLSGGEKKKSEIAQMLALRPRLVILDEIDSGLDVDSLKSVAKAIESSRDGKRMLLIITHYANILKYIKPDFVHVMMDGKIVKSGGPKFAKEIEEKGYEWMKQE